jgi:hypothetical protein
VLSLKVWDDDDVRIHVLYLNQSSDVLCMPDVAIACVLSALVVSATGSRLVTSMASATSPKPGKLTSERFGSPKHTKKQRQQADNTVFGYSPPPEEPNLLCRDVWRFVQVTSGTDGIKMGWSTLHTSSCGFCCDGVTCVLCC